MPPSLDEAAIAKAPAPSKFGKKNKGWDKKPQPQEETSSDIPEEKGAAATKDVAETSFLRLVPRVQTVPLTPDIYVSYMCAIARGYGGDLGEFLGLVAKDFWTGRDINPYEIVANISSDGKGEGKTKEVAA